MENYKEKIEATLQILKKVKNQEEYNVEELKNYEVNSRQSFKGMEYEFDVDSSPAAWQYFCELKKWNYQDIERDNNRLYYKRNNNRLYYKRNDIYIAGDCSFNFNEKKYAEFKGMLSEKENEDEELKEKLLICKHMHHNLLNFDLMPRTGGMNDIKGNLKYKNNEIRVHGSGRKPKSDLFDRLDTFVCFMNTSFQKLHSLEKESSGIKEIGGFFSNSIFTESMKSENFEALYDFIMRYKDINSYCKEIYAVDSEDFIRRLIDSGNEPIYISKDESKKNKERLNEYMSLAIDYWILKGETYIKIKEDNQNNNSVIDNNIAIL